GAGDVDGQHPVPVLDGDRLDVGLGDVDRHPGVVDQPVEPAPPLLGGRDEAPGGLGVGDVALHVGGVAQLGGGRPAGLDRPGRVHDDGGAGPGEPPGDRLADAAGRAGDDDDVVGEVHGLPSVRWLRCPATMRHRAAAVEPARPAAARRPASSTNGLACTTPFPEDRHMTKLTIDDLFSVRDKVVVVTGGSRGIGEMIAAGFLANGAKVYITSRKAEVCDATAERLSAEYGGTCVSIPANLAELEGIDGFVAGLREHESAVDVL